MDEAEFEQLVKKTAYAYVGWIMEIESGAKKDSYMLEHFRLKDQVSEEMARINEWDPKDLSDFAKAFIENRILNSAVRFLVVMKNQKHGIQRSDKQAQDWVDAYKS